MPPQNHSFSRVSRRMPVGGVRPEDLEFTPVLQVDDLLWPGERTGMGDDRLAVSANQVMQGHQISDNDSRNPAGKAPTSLCTAVDTGEGGLAGFHHSPPLKGLAPLSPPRHFNLLSATRTDSVSVAPP